MLPSKPADKPLLQGWAIVDNTVGEDWTGVQLSLVAGAPQSFIQKVSQPVYSRRPEIPLQQGTVLTPQTHDATLIAGGARLVGSVTDSTGTPIQNVRVRVLDTNNNVLAQTTTSSAGAYAFPSLPEGPVRVEAEMAGFQRTTSRATLSGSSTATANLRLEIGSMAQTVTVEAEVPTIQTESSSATRAGGRNLGSGAGLGRGSGGGVGSGMGSAVVTPVYSVPQARASAQSMSTAQSLGDLFEYKLREPITIRKNQSAMVPIVQASGIGAEKVSIWNPSSGSLPYRAVWLTNSTGLTLDGGSFSVTEGEAFAGEGLFDPIRPDEKRLISYAADLALTTSARDQSRPQRVTRVVVRKGVMIHHSEEVQTRTYTVRNQDATPRTVIVEHPVRYGFELRSEARPAETTPAWMRFRLAVSAKTTAELVVDEARPLETNYTIAKINSEQLAVFVRAKTIPSPVREAIERVIRQQDVVAELKAKASQLEEESEKIFDDQQRLRENLKALKGSAEEKALVQRYTRQLDGQENRLEELKKERKELEAKTEAAEKLFEEIIEGLAFDGKI